VNSKQYRNELEIDEPFGATVSRIEGPLWHHAKELGDLVEQQLSHTPGSEGASRPWYARFLFKGGRALSQRECFDVARPQADGSRLRLYTVTISRDTTPGTTTVIIDPYEDAGEEGVKAADSAKEAIRAAIKEDENLRMLASATVAGQRVAGSSPGESDRLETAVERALLQYESKERQRIPAAMKRGLSPEATWEEIEELDRCEREFREYIVSTLLDGLAAKTLKYTQNRDGSISLLAAWSGAVQKVGWSRQLSVKAACEELKNSLEHIMKSSEPGSLGELLSEIRSTGIEVSWRVENDSPGKNYWWVSFKLPANVKR
jgi:hypothetical protein